MSFYDDMHYEDHEHGITGWGYLPTAEQERVNDAVYIMELEEQGFRLATILETRGVESGVNWRFGDPSAYMKTHWQMFEPGYATEEDEAIADAALVSIEEFRHKYGEGNVTFAIPTDRMLIEADLDPGNLHNLFAVMVRQPHADSVTG